VERCRAYWSLSRFCRTFDRIIISVLQMYIEVGAKSRMDNNELNNLAITR